MINRKSTFFLGIFIFLIPFLGLPSSGKSTLIMLAGLTLVWLSITVTFTLPRRNHGSHEKLQEKQQEKIQEKITAKKPRAKKLKDTPLTIETILPSAHNSGQQPEQEHETDTDQA